MKHNEVQNPLLQEDNLSQMRRRLKPTEMITVYRWGEASPMDWFILGGILPYRLAQEVLTDGRYISSVLENIHPYPYYCDTGEKDSAFYPYGSDEHQYNSVPLVISRVYGDVAEPSLELCQEYRLFHNLYHDTSDNTYTKEGQLIATIKSGEVKVRLREIKEYLAERRMYLSLLFEFNKYSEKTLEELGLDKIEREGFERKGNTMWVYDQINTDTFPLGTFGKHRSTSRLRGRRIIGSR